MAKTVPTAAPRFSTVARHFIPGLYFAPAEAQRGFCQGQAHNRHAFNNKSASFARTRLRRLFAMRQELIKSALPLPTDSVTSAVPVAEAVARALGYLLDQLEPLVGLHGASALYGRSVHLVRRDRSAVLSDAKGTREEQLACLHDDLARLDIVEARAIATALLTTFADLLTSLIGEPLTNRLLRSAWSLPPANAVPIEEKAK